MSAREAERLARFIVLLLEPATFERDDAGGAHNGIARALLGSRYRWAPLDRGFLRAMACCHLVSQVEFDRLMGLFETARERSA